jgi:membrane-associated protease RseP (regulator of RpoE activity)
MVKKKASSKKEFENSGLLKPFLIAVFLLVLTIYEFFTNGQTLIFWLAFFASVIVIFPNLLWLKLKWGTVVGIPYGLTMLRTKHTINIINFLAKHGKILEKISIVGMFLGFGLTGIDYWIAREKGGFKRIGILIVGAIILGILFVYFVSMIFAAPILAPLIWFGLISFILLGFGGLSIAFLIGYGAISLNALLIGKQICPSIAPVLPGVPIPGMGVIVPLIGWVSLGLILIIHEASHGIMLSYYKEKIKSVGLILAGILPVGAFVEQDDNTFNKRNERKQLIVLSAGPTSNLVSMIVGFGILLLFMSIIPVVATDINAEFEKTYSGVQIEFVQDEVSFCGITEVAPAKDKFVEGDQIISLNGTKIDNFSQLNSGFRAANLMNFVVLRDGEEKEIELEPVLFEDLNIKKIGVKFGFISTGYDPPIGYHIASILISSFNSILIFFIVLSFAVGMFNFMPTNPLDGGRMAQIILVPYFGFMKFKTKKETQLFIGRLFIWLVLIAVAFNLLPYVTMIF